MVSQLWSQKETEERLRNKQSLLYSQAQETGGAAHHTGPHGKAIRVVRRQKIGAMGEHWARDFIGVSVGRQGKAG